MTSREETLMNLVRVLMIGRPEDLLWPAICLTTRSKKERNELLRTLSLPAPADPEPDSKPTLKQWTNSTDRST